MLAILVLQVLFHSSAICLQFWKQTLASAIHFVWLYQLGVKTASFHFRIVAIWNIKNFNLGHPVLIHLVKKAHLDMGTLIYNLEKFIFSCWIIAPMGKMKTKGLAQEEKHTGQNLKQKSASILHSQWTSWLKMKYLSKMGFCVNPNVHVKKHVGFLPMEYEKCCKRITFLLFLYYSSDEYCVRTGKFKLLC